ncbi:MAG: FixH family protein [Gammaproteobacteria bacterium]|nr:FixH family protein [Gammaproteobacteria bacterium]
MGGPLVIRVGSRAGLLVSLLASLLASLAVVSSAATAQTAGEPGTRWWPSEAGHFRVSYQSRLEPITINRLHQWVLTVTDAAGEPVDGARIRVNGGMPAHDHGLPTEPRVVEALGGGRYLLDGVRFHMHGAWEVVLQLEADGSSDTVTITLDL